MCLDIEAEKVYETRRNHGVCVFCQIVEQQWQQEDGIIPRFWKGRLEQ